MTLRKLVSPLIAGLGILHAASAWTLGLGELVEQSAVGQPLRLRIRLVSAGQDLDPACMRLAPGQGRDLPWVRDARLAIERGTSESYLLVTGMAPIYHPILMLGIATGCEGGMRREYTLLLPANPALERATTAEQPAAQAAGRAMAPPAATPSLLDLAHEAFPGSRSARRRFIAAARRSAPGAFPDAASLRAPLPQGIELDVERLKKAAAPRPRAKPAHPPAAPAATKPSAAAKVQPAPAPPAAHAAERPAGNDRLVLFGGAPETRLKLSFALSAPGRGGTVGEQERERLRKEQRLVMALDEKIMTQMELASRIHELEALQARLTEESRQLDALAQADPAEPPNAASGGAIERAEGPVAELARQTPAPTEPPEQAPPLEPPRDWLWPALAATAALLLLLLFRLRRRTAEAGEPEATTADDAADNGAQASATAPDDELQLDFPLDEDGDEQAVGSEIDLPTGEIGAEAPSVDFAPMDWTPPADDLSAHSSAPLPGEEALEEEHESAVELADIMMSFGRVQGAAQTLADFIRHNPKQGVSPWIKLLDVYKAADMRGEFDGLTRQLNATFNVKVVSWDEFDAVRVAAETLESMPHIVARLNELWPSRECQVYLHTLLRDNRDGTRQGFPIAVVDEILCLLSLLNELAGPFRAQPGDFKDEKAPAAAEDGQEDPVE